MKNRGQQVYLHGLDFPVFVSWVWLKHKLTLHLVSGGLNDLKRWVLGSDKGAVVKEPVELVNLVKAEIEGMSQNYQASLINSE